MKWAVAPAIRTHTMGHRLARGGASDNKHVDGDDFFAEARLAGWLGFVGVS